MKAAPPATAAVPATSARRLILKLIVVSSPVVFWFASASRCDADGLEIGRAGDLDHRVVVRILDHAVADPRLLVHARPGLEADLADALETDPRPALEHVDHLEVELVEVLVAGSLAARRWPDDVGAHAPAGALDHAEVAVLEIAAQTGVPARIGLVADVEPALGESGGRLRRGGARLACRTGGAAAPDGLAGPPRRLARGLGPCARRHRSPSRRPSGPASRGRLQALARGGNRLVRRRPDPWRRRPAHG